MKSALIVGAVLAASSAFAADLPTKSKPSAPAVAVSVGNWAGFYTGVNAGGGSAGNCWSYLKNLTGAAAGSVGKEGCQNAGIGIAGAQVGYNWQVSDMVYGLEVSEGFASSSTKMISALYSSDNIKTQVTSIGTLSAKVGYAFADNLVYLKSGLAWQGNKYQRDIDIAHIATTGWSEKGNQVRKGVVVGAGVEHKYSSNISLALEYDYVGFGSANKAMPTVQYGSAPPSPLITAYNKISQSDHLVTLRLNYFFK